MSDPRFRRLRTDPRFRRPRKKEAKAVVDDRFGSVLTSKKEKRRGLPVDKYGRSAAKDTTENLNRFYRREDEQPSFTDYARGEILLDSSEEEEEEDSESDGAEVILANTQTNSQHLDASEVDLNEYETTLTAATGSGSTAQEASAGDANQTHRLAVVNLDWDHLKASHLFRIFHSVLSPSFSTNDSSENSSSRGRVLSVRVYPSEFGQARMQAEEVHGPPKEIFKAARNADKLVDLEDDGNEYNEEALRKYQLEKLRYYYAIVDFDTVDAASYAYSELDGTELERTANIFDISFVPDEMTFDQEFRDETTSETATAEASLALPDFSTDALRHSKVKLTWDDDDPERNLFTRRKLTKKEIEENDFGAFIASDSDESGQEQGTDEEDGGNGRRDVLRSLLLGDGDGDTWADAYSTGGKTSEEMEITFTPGLDKAKSDDEGTTLDRYRLKMKEKRKARKASRTGDSLPQTEVSSSGDDNDVGPVDTASKPRKKGSGRIPLASGSAPDSKHFDMKAIIKAEKKAKKGKRARRSKDDTEVDQSHGDFQIDVVDERFAAIHDDHRFAIDPSNPVFKQTKGMSALLTESSGRKTANQSNESAGSIAMNNKPSSGSLDGLVKSVKHKSSMLGSSSSKRRKL